MLDRAEDIFFAKILDNPRNGLFGFIMTALVSGYWQGPRNRDLYNRMQATDGTWWFRFATRGLNISTQWILLDKRGEFVRDKSGGFISHYGATPDSYAPDNSEHLKQTLSTLENLDWSAIAEKFEQAKAKRDAE